MTDIINDKFYDKFAEVLSHNPHVIFDDKDGKKTLMLGKDSVNDFFLRPLAARETFVIGKSLGVKPKSPEEKTMVRVLGKALKSITAVQVTEENYKHVANINYCQANIAAALIMGNTEAAKEYRNGLSKSFEALNIDKEEANNDFDKIQESLKKVRYYEQSINKGNGRDSQNTRGRK